MEFPRESLIKNLLVSVGEDPERQGLVNTPSRVNKAWNEFYCGYKQDPKDVFTTFEEDILGPGQLILLKNIEFFSHCEHHLVPFFGTAHIAYISADVVLGASKLARLLDIYAKRLQMQERIGKQVTSDLMEYLKPQGAACIIKAKHLCISSRGIGKQQSEFVTSSLTGCFLEESDTRAELYSMISI